MYGAAFTNPVDFLKMFFGLGNNNAYFDQTYYDKMNHWYRSHASYYNDNHTIIRFNTAVMFFSTGFFTIHTIVMCFLSTIGLVGIYKFFVNAESRTNKLLLILLFLSPSLLFWASGVLKEGLVIFGLGMMLWNLKAWLERKTTANLAGVVFSILLLAATKYYVLSVALPGILALVVCNKFPTKSPLLIFSSSYLFALVLFFGIGKISTKIDPASDLANKQKDFILLAQGGIYLEAKSNLATDTIFVPSAQYARIIKSAKGKLNLDSVKAIQFYKMGKLSSIKPNTLKSSTIALRALLDNGITHSRLDIPRIDGTLISYIKATPKALFNSICQPINPEKNPFYWLAFLENIVYLVLAVYFLIQIKNVGSLLHSSLFIFSLLFVISLLLLTGFTTPVIGALVRYKVPALPLIMGLLTFLNNRTAKA